MRVLHSVLTAALSSLLLLSLGSRAEDAPKTDAAPVDAKPQATKPARRPMRRIIREIGKVVSAVPTTMIAAGRVAQEAAGASCEPTSTAVTANAVVTEP